MLAIQNYFMNQNCTKQGYLKIVSLFFFFGVFALSAKSQHILYRDAFKNLQLGPGQQETWFLDNVSLAAVRTFTPAINGSGPTTISPNGSVTHTWNAWDSKIEITNVFYIFKGEGHATDGTGGQLTYQVNVTIRNLDTVHPVSFDVLMAEIFPN